MLAKLLWGNMCRLVFGRFFKQGANSEITRNKTVNVLFQSKQDSEASMAIAEQCKGLSSQSIQMCKSDFPSLLIDEGRHIVWMHGHSDIVNYLATQQSKTVSNNRLS